MPPPPRIPRATYRLQLNAGFTLRDALEVVPYLDALGVSHLYLSSFFKARPGSLHGYDIVDHNAFNPEIGDEADLDTLVQALEARGMGIILDFVPNHMGVSGKENDWWLDVLEWGERSPYAGFFDIDWNPGRRDRRGKVLLPILGDNYGTVLERGELVPKFDDESGTISVWYWEHRLPIAVGHYPRLLQPATQQLDGEFHAALEEVLHGLRTGLAGGRRKKDSLTVARREADAAKARLAALAKNPEACRALDSAVARLAGTPGDPASFAPLHRLLERQSYHVACWRVAGAEINYRRFFDINDLAGLRQESPQVFEATHRLVLRLLEQGKIHGLRIDHIDGLFNPAQYCQRLQRRAADALGLPGAQPLYLLVEKILAHHERLRRDWPVAGTTGYEFMNEVNGLFVNPENASLLETVYQQFIEATMDFAQQVHEAKLLVTREHMAGEMHVLGMQLARLAASHWRSRDFTIDALREALRAVVAQFPIYRTYVTPRRVPQQDKGYIAWAVAQARKGAAEPSIFDFLQAVLDTSIARGRRALYSRAAVLAVAMHLQQYTGPVMAKGFEDTALYRYNRLIALNEVGGEPRRFGVSPGAFHQVNLRRLGQHPYGMLATATHDSKRGEDVRARIDALSEIPNEWLSHLQRWARLNHALRHEVDGGVAPARNDEYFLYQTMLGAWPLAGPDADDFVERLCAATLKAIREAKHRTSWHQPDEAYEQATLDFVRRLVGPQRRGMFLDDFVALQQRVARIGMVNSLAQTLLKLTAPGVPDIYQGCESWQLALVDPDNRRPVDYEQRRRLLERVQGMPLADLLGQWQDGGVKLGLIWHVLAFRRRWPELFTDGGYRALQVRGERAEHVVAFARHQAEGMAIAAVPRLLAPLWPEAQALPPLGKAWSRTYIELPQRITGETMTDALGGPPVPITRRRGRPTISGEHMFATFPVAFLSDSAPPAQHALPGQG